MTIEFRCPTCAKVLKTTDDKAGRQAACPGCGEALSVPGLEHASRSEPDVEPRVPPVSGDPFDSAFGAPPRAAASVAPGTAWHTGSSGPKVCEACAEDLPPNARGTCPFCGEPLREVRRRPLFAPHRSGVVLALSIVSWIPGIPFLVCGIVAWTMGSYDLKEMNEGRMDPSGRSQTSTGRIIAICSVLFYGLIIAAIISVFIAMAVFDGWN